ncbi:MAG: signal peptidase I [Clostridia bacterium]|jgi:signal peptidase I|nr:signal peptidase I [Clostridia bacterium]
MAEKPLEIEQTGDSRVKRKKEYKKRETKGWIISMALAVVIALSLRFFVFEFIRVEGQSMEPTLINNEYVFMQKVLYYFDSPKYGDIVICSFPNRTETFVKRVVGVEGDVIRITNGTLYINDVANYEHYDKAVGIDHDMAELTVAQDSVFVMGDNRNHSMDSSNSGVGVLSEDMIHGRAEFVLWPLNMVHGLK